MRKTLLVLYSFFVSSIAWLPPERCEQHKILQRPASSDATKHADVINNIGAIAAKQHALLKDTYKDHKFFGVPIRAGCASDVPTYIYSPYNCTFHTYDPRLLFSVVCDNVACKLVHTVSTLDTYTSSEGYNWGVKISSKASFFHKIFEVGGEASTAGTYSCTYTKAKTTSDTVECSVSEGKNGHLQLYTIKSDMECDFGKTTLEVDPRNKENLGVSPVGYFTRTELNEIKQSAAARFQPCSDIMIDINKISDSLLQKILKEIPQYNPYTDTVSVNSSAITVNYFKKTTTVSDYRKIIPFTNEGGDSVFQYACRFDSAQTIKK